MPTYKTNPKKNIRQDLFLLFFDNMMPQLHSTISPCHYVVLFEQQRAQLYSPRRQTPYVMGLTWVLRRSTWLHLGLFVLLDCFVCAWTVNSHSSSSVWAVETVSPHHRPEMGTRVCNLNSSRTEITHSVTSDLTWDLASRTIYFLFLLFIYLFRWCWWNADLRFKLVYILRSWEVFIEYLSFKYNWCFWLNLNICVGNSSPLQNVYTFPLCLESAMHIFCANATFINEVPCDWMILRLDRLEWP